MTLDRASFRLWPRGLDICEERNMMSTGDIETESSLVLGGFHRQKGRYLFCQGRETELARHRSYR